MFWRKTFFSTIGIQLMECYISHQNVYVAHNNTKLLNDINIIECDEMLQDPIRWWPFLYLVKFTWELQIIYLQTSAWLLHRIYKLHMKYNTIILQFCVRINSDPYTICYPNSSLHVFYKGILIEVDLSLINVIFCNRTFWLMLWRD